MSRSRLRWTSSVRRSKLHAAKPTAGTMKKEASVAASRMRKERDRLLHRGRGGRPPETSSASNHRAAQHGRVEEHDQHPAHEQRDRTPKVDRSVHHTGSSGQHQGILVAHYPALAAPARPGKPGRRSGRRCEREPVQRRPGSAGLEQAADPTGDHQLRPGTDAGGEHLILTQPHHEDVVHSRHARDLRDPLRLVRIELAHHGGQKRQRQIERVERQLFDQRAVAGPERQLRGVALIAQGGAAPQRVHLRARGRRRCIHHLLAEALQQRNGQGVGLVAEPRDVALGDLDLPAELGAPGHERAGAAGHQGDAADRGPPRGGHRHEEQRRRPQERVPIRPPASRAPDQHADRRRRQRDHDSARDPRHRSVLGIGPAEQRRRGHDQGRGREQDGKVPARARAAPTRRPPAG